ncbi:MAG: pseudaminic acid biosynthesis-associated methylase [Geitlerinemataceae cyanobacterium]
MPFKTHQEEFWAGKFGDDYIDRNRGADLLARNVSLFQKTLNCTQAFGSCLELGANIGMNLRALQVLYPGQDQHAVEINKIAVEELSRILPDENIHHTSILDFVPTRTWGLVLIKGVLIHVNPEYLEEVYRLLYSSSSQYILMCEYYNPIPVTVSYRGNSDRLFKRDFCGEFMDLYPNLRLADYGFIYRRDPKFPQDDFTWFLLEKV